MIRRKEAIRVKVGGREEREREGALWVCLQGIREQVKTTT